MFNSLFISNQKSISGLNDETKSIYVYNLFKKKNKTIVFIANTLYEASKFYQSINNYTSDVLFFPMDDFLTSEALAISPELKTIRLETLNIMDEPKIVVTNLMGYLRYLPPKQVFNDKKIHVRVNDCIKIDELCKKLLEIGYTRESTVNKTGEIAVRGYVLDVFPINEQNPVRLLWWGDNVEEIRPFNIDTQLTLSSSREITINSNTELLVPQEDADLFAITQKDLNKYISPTNISNYVEDSITIFNDYDELKESYTNLLNEMVEYSISKGLDGSTPYMHDFSNIRNKDEVFLYRFDNSSYHFNVSDIDNGLLANGKLLKRLNAYIEDNKTVIICFNDRYQINKLLDEYHFNLFVLTNEDNIYNNKVNLIIKKMSSGFIYENYVVITLKELYNTKDSKAFYKTNFKLGTKIRDITKLEKGDYIVHYIYGIGRYLGLKTLSKDGNSKDYLNIEYRDSDHLYIPVEKIELIMKFASADGTTPKLSKIGGIEWLKTRNKASLRAKAMANELIELYTARGTIKGFNFGKDSVEQEIFENEFEFTATNDQLKAISEIKIDMEQDKPMDRLVCGDVGYGKTEVAFRAIFKAIMAGKQVAFLCPTTILSNQHYQNALKRFNSFPIDIAILNRFNSLKDVNGIKEGLKSGHIDLLIGTHRILSDDIEYKDLGLLIIDEEQRFGVKHKEKIKQYKNSIDVLTLSATPIPRTLQMSMAGLRDLSLIETPPSNRYPIQTYVLEENKQIIKDAIYKEMSRCGQVFLLYNSVENMESKKNEIAALVPEARIIYGHGRMNKDELEKVMFKFINKEADVLLCTTIIETGIDIPSVNTLIIIDADRFGLAQLYQIRGRVGRSDKIAYCYLMYNKNKILTEVAVKRLKAIKEFTELGSGFSIAMRDLSIRGSGDILGSEQAGFVASVGVEMFMRMLDEEIKKIKGERIKEIDVEPVINVATSIDNDYVSDEELKIEIHKKINTIDSYDKLIKIKNEIEDRFGKINEKMDIYMHEEWFSKKIEDYAVSKITQNDKYVEIMFENGFVDTIDGEYLFVESLSLSRNFKFSTRGNHLIVLLEITKLDKHFVYYLLELLNIIDKSKKNKT